MLKRLVITGYKAHELGIFNDKHPGIPIIKKAVENRLLPLIETGLEWVIISGQPGVETWAAEVAIDLQLEYPELQLAVITPFEDQEKNWNEAKQEAYENLMIHADYTVSLTKRPYEAPWQFIEKDKFLLRNSDGLLLVYDEDNEGSPKFMKKMAVSYAEKSDYEVITITADDLQLVAEDMQRQDWN
ncbi:UPF0398 protein YpsA [Sporosarcina sp. NCCP-2222]|uniref:SLOG family protein n=1 Tax=Sporosarcina sp. NCCP-2222 TaxID=2935073 RepID=UPI00208B446F|nr:DUF1273 domain-containing protein [Sporosarcina sp. NCCP-2222]GKV55811.1 UPF0398 protein YpsA [Sporosarcina sp. NCCP-2222]